MQRMEVVEQILKVSGIGVDRMKLRWVSAAEGQLFANLVSELSQVVQALGVLIPMNIGLTWRPLTAL